MTLRHLLFSMSLLASVMVTSQAARAEESVPDLNSAVKQLAANVADVLGSLKKGKTLMVSEFRGEPAQLGASGGTGITNRLIDALKQQKLDVQPLADLALEGTFGRDVDDLGRPVLKLHGKLTDENGQALFEFNQIPDVHGTEEVAQALGLTFETPANESGKKQAERIQEAITNPPLHLEGTRIQTVRESPYAVEIVVRDAKGKYVAVEPRKIAGKAFVPLKLDDIYGVHVYNNSGHDAAVTLTIDGLNVFEFSQFKDQYRFYVIGDGQSGLIPGWHRTNESSDAFQITGYSKSPAAKLLSDVGKLGTITATFCAAWNPDDLPPGDEFESQQKRGRGEPLATGRGPNVVTNFREVSREFGRVRTAISVRYNKPAPPADGSAANSGS